ncbi:MAG TPA: chloramphenicol acetyltransferase [Gammaproteobacteria bacterium]|nr:chloramphenicol acetyltransferase [Gammaproteobacteria bacterium]HCK92957.1 chloramphenicol acetyltransferase [Gammaproteobacteria bacterium]|tara:strand:- start:72209 stop:72838 length:630 start_codon:yes stop_codon:yes gene_type:complete
MAIICLEGPSSIGKTTLCAELKKKHDFIIIPEVNKLFERPEHAGADWYLEKQIERLQMAQTKSTASQHVVLDGDPLQPLWYNWIFPELKLYPLDHVIQFFGRAIKEKTFVYPDHYFLLTTSLEELTRRKENDATRARKNFATHLKMIEPQQALFQQIQQEYPDFIDILEHDSSEKTLKFIAQKASSLQSCAKSEALFDLEVSTMQSTAL